MKPLLDRLPKPAPADVNSGLSDAKPSTLLTLFGPAWKGSLGEDCGEIRREYRQFISTKDCGPFRASGNTVFLQLISEAFAEVFARNPDLYHSLGTAGCLCARLVRGSRSTPSNHSWGTAIDLTISGVLDDRGDNKCLRGLLELYPFMHKRGIYWGTEYPTEDSMHWGMSDELLWRLALDGRFGTAVQAKAKAAGR